ncbi:hypothetical protein diail_1949 [Diaporthe ilicicola]|nr:hypothetical protein diail_1949 [Diaporthe ilicicola]
MEIVLGTGGNGGIGLEVVRQLVRDHGQRFHILIGCRNLSDGENAVQELQSEGHGEVVEAIQIDITDEESLAAAAQLMITRFGKLDVLHANAGISVDKEYGGGPISEIITRAVATNAAGSAASVEQFVPLLSKAENPRIIFMSSGAGSLKLAHQFGFVKDYPAYCVSKAAENMIMIYYHHRFPEWKATKINNYGAGVNETPGPISEGASNAVRLTLLGKDGESGTHTMLQASQDEYSKTMEGKDTIVTVPW